MILYVNGDSHSAGAEAVNSFAFANDDPKFHFLGRLPHPANLEVSYSQQLANLLGYELHCDAESASSNSRILRTTREYLKENRPDLIIIGWSTWERDEWLYNDIYWQVNAGGIGEDWPDRIKDTYKEWIVGLDYKQKARQAHADIIALDQELNQFEIPHLFFNSYNSFDDSLRVTWGNRYLDPYDPNRTYWKWLSDQGFKSNQNYHFNADAHQAWAKFLLTKLTDESIITT